MGIHFPTPENADAIFSEVKLQMARALKHPYIPKPCQERLTAALNNSVMLPDVEFEKKHASDNVLTDGETDSQEAIKEEIRPHNAFITRSDSRNIFFRRSYFTLPRVRIFAQDLFAEELAHAIGQRSVLHLKDIEDDSDLFYPFKSKPELIDFLNQDLVERNIQGLEVRPEDVKIEIDGFGNMYSDAKSGIKFRIIEETTFLEEARAAVLQYVIQAIYHGSKNALLDPKNQFIRGKAYLDKMMKLMAPAYSRELGAHEFLSKYREGFNSDKDLVLAVFNFMATKNYEQFYRSLSKRNKIAFQALVDYTSREVKSRGRMRN